MLVELFPKAHTRFSSLPLLGSIADSFTQWLQQQGYRRGSIRQYVRELARLDAMIRLLGTNSLSDISREDLIACRPANSQDNRILAGAISTLERYLDAHSFLPSSCLDPLSPGDAVLADYKHFLTDVRGLSRSTITGHLNTVSCFLGHLGYESDPSRLVELKACDIETFITYLGKRHCRGSLQHEAAQLRGFLRFGTAMGILPPGLDACVDTPRLYRLEQLPRALPWENICVLLDSIDRSTPMGLRDHAMLFLIATYGLRACDIRSLRLEDIRWRQGEIQVAQCKTRQSLVLPLTDTAGDVLIQYLRDGRPQAPFRQLFLRVRAPIGPFKSTGVHDVFTGCVKRSGLKFPFTGIHCLRHSYALHLLRQGTPLKTIGDLLGHRTAESTCVYLRLDIEDLREVALDVPGGCTSSQNLEVPQ
ncbi:MAG: integrase [Gammaproteobacteria bacterium]|nr:MAG: integrase [Gammaproteobacteria bacterium]